jgi:hypothetical protein
LEVEVTLQREAELEQFFGQGYRALSVMERHLSDRKFFVGDHDRGAGRDHWTRWRMAQTFRDETLISRKLGA